jgi:hypothetical protein
LFIFIQSHWTTNIAAMNGVCNWKLHLAAAVTRSIVIFIVKKLTNAARCSAIAKWMNNFIDYSYYDVYKCSCVYKRLSFYFHTIYLCCYSLLSLSSYHTYLLTRLLAYTRSLACLWSAEMKCWIIFEGIKISKTRTKNTSIACTQKCMKKAFCSLRRRKSHKTK